MECELIINLECDSESYFCCTITTCQYKSFVKNKIIIKIDYNNPTHVSKLISYLYDQGLHNYYDTVIIDEDTYIANLIGDILENGQNVVDEPEDKSDDESSIEELYMQIMEIDAPNMPKLYVTTEKERIKLKNFIKSTLNISNLPNDKFDKLVKMFWDKR